MYLFYFSINLLTRTELADNLSLLTDKSKVKSILIDSYKSKKKRRLKRTFSNQHLFKERTEEEKEF